MKVEIIMTRLSRTKILERKFSSKTNDPKIELPMTASEEEGRWMKRMLL